MPQPNLILYSKNLSQMYVASVINYYGSGAIHESQISEFSPSKDSNT